MLMRQPRVKKDAEPGNPSPEYEPRPPRIISPGQTTSIVQNINLPSAASSSSSQDWQSHSEPTTPSTKNLLTLSSGSSTNLLAVPQPSYLVKQHSHPLLPSQQPSTSGQHWMPRQHSNPEYPARGSRPSETTTDPIPVIKIEEGQSEGAKPGTGSGLRIVPPEFLRSSSTPQMSSTSLETRGSDQRQVHCPVQRPGPALGCNHCWNTVDTHGRTLRRKTKYHCPECQINLCIVPCFQEFHGRSQESSNILAKTSSI